MIFKERVIFRFKDQKIFSEISGDYNSIHLDKIQARKSIFGNIIVHGINLLITSLNLLTKNINNISFEELNINFIKPNYLNKFININYHIIDNNFEIITEQNKQNTSIIKGKFLSDNKHSNCDYILKDLTFVKNLTDKELFKKYYKFINSKKLIDEFSELILTSKIIGVIDPGEFSLFSGLDLIRKKKINTKNSYLKKISEIDSIGLIKQKVISNNFVISLKSFRLNKPIIQKSIKEFKNKIPKKVFKDQNSMVIGGSRGIGEIITKCLVLGGSNVTFTYNYGFKDAKRIEEDINLYDYQVQTLKLDIFNKKNINSVFKQKKLDNLYYFPSPKIMEGNSKLINPVILNEMCKYYSIKFYEIAKQFILNGGSYIFFPSTIYLNNPNTKFKEYILAKKMGEVSCELLKKEFPNINIDCLRLDPILTDQTKSILLKNELSDSDLKFVDQFISLNFK